MGAQLARTRLSRKWCSAVTSPEIASHSAESCDVGPGYGHQGCGHQGYVRPSDAVGRAVLAAIASQRTRASTRAREPAARPLMLRRSAVRMRRAPHAPAMAAATGLSLQGLDKSWRFTQALPPDPLYPTPAASHATPRERFVPRQVRGALFTWVRPEPQRDPDLLAVSAAALRDLGLRPAEAAADGFAHFAAGNSLLGWDEDRLDGGYPWAQCYGGFQFGQWAGQLGDGRAISLFESTNPATGVRHELQLKGAGLTPYSRFADGKAVLRSSIREFVVSEALHALGIPTTRALALTRLPHARVVRETVEPGAIVLRFAQSWLRLGTFDLLRARGDRDLIRKLAIYVAEDVLGGWEALPGRLDDPDRPGASPTPTRGIAADALQGPDDAAENRFTRLYREVVRRNAATVAAWQAYGFMNGVLVPFSLAPCPSSLHGLTPRAQEHGQHVHLRPVHGLWPVWLHGRL